MKFIHCPECGALLVKREIGDEGLMNYCEHCKKPVFDQPAVCIIALAVNEQGEAALLRQNYINAERYVCVSGYLKSGESAEECTRREIHEELGLEIQSLTPIHTYYLAQKDMLMLGYLARVAKAEFQLSGEVDSARWVPLQQAHVLGPKSETSAAQQLIRACQARLKDEFSSQPTNFDEIVGEN